jgi:uncharacterized protein (DUF1697 family)
MQYAAFLRAINVGKHNRITMQALRELIDPLGYHEVRTYLQSGNIVFDADGPRESVTARIEQTLGDAGLRNASVILRAREELFDLLAAKPFDAYNPADYRRYVTLLGSPLSPDVLTAMRPAPWLVAARPLELLTINPIAAPDPNFNRVLNRDFGVASTTRYWNVIEAVAALFRPFEPLTAAPP